MWVDRHVTAEFSFTCGRLLPPVLLLSRKDPLYYGLATLLERMKKEETDTPSGRQRALLAWTRERNQTYWNGPAFAVVVLSSVSGIRHSFDAGLVWHRFVSLTFDCVLKLLLEILVSLLCVQTSAFVYSTCRISSIRKQFETDWTKPVVKFRYCQFANAPCEINP